MADEEKTPQDVSDETIEEIAHSVPAADEYPEGQADEVKAQAGEDADVVEKATVAALEVTEKAQNSAPAKAFDSAINKIEAAIESVDEEPHAVHHGDTTVFMGKEYNIPVYTSVFIALGAFTLLEIALAELISSNAKIPLLLAIAVAKALLVVMFYMHLKDDSRIFAIALAVPLAIGVLSALFLVAIPTGY